ncbi:hypothetical protein HY384_02825 [Candidatus Daviesbacteria bacterium]|nr:hypothetical protein [Candidatus Daviesbacteria bacterium]
MVNKLLTKLTTEELKILSQFFIDVAKGVLGVPIIAYFISGISQIALLLGFMLDLVIVTTCVILAFKLGRVAKRRQNGR